VEGLDLDEVLRLMQHDKKFITGQNRFVLLSDLGEWTERQGVPEPLVRGAAERALA